MGTIQRLQKACQLVKKRKKAYIKNVELKSGADLEDESCRDSKPISAGNRKGNDLCNFLQMFPADPMPPRGPQAGRHRTVRAPRPPGLTHAQPLLPPKSSSQ